MLRAAEKKTVYKMIQNFCRIENPVNHFSWYLHTHKVWLTWNLVKHPNTVPYSFMWERNLETSKRPSYSRISFSMLWAFLSLYNKHSGILAGLATSFWVPSFFSSLINQSLLERAIDWASGVLSSNASSDTNKSIRFIGLRFPVKWGPELGDLWIFFKFKMLWCWEIGQLSENLSRLTFSPKCPDWSRYWTNNSPIVGLLKHKLNGCFVIFTKYSNLSICLRTNFPNYQLPEIRLC